MGPTWVLSAPDGPHVGPMNLALRDDTCSCVMVYTVKALYLAVMFSPCKRHNTRKHFLNFWTFVRAMQWSPVGTFNKGPEMCNFNVFFVVSINIMLVKQESCRWFEMPWRSGDIITLRLSVRLGMCFVSSNQTGVRKLPLLLCVRYIILHPVGLQRKLAAPQQEFILTGVPISYVQHFLSEIYAVLSMIDV